MSWKTATRPVGLGHGSDASSCSYRPIAICP
jgi:hypothetical protein